MADTLDLLTLGEGKTAINQTGTTHDTEIAQWITAVSRRIDDLCGSVVRRDVTERHPGGTTTIFLEEWPVASIAACKEYSGSTATTLTAEDLVGGTVGADTYELEADTGIVRRRRNAELSTFARTAVIVTYSSGRYATTAAVDAKFKTAAGAILRRLWAREAPAWARGDLGGALSGGDDETKVQFFKAVDPMVVEFLGDELRGPKA